MFSQFKFTVKTIQNTQTILKNSRPSAKMAGKLTGKKV